MFDIDFDRCIDSRLPADELWGLMKSAFENPADSPIWPVELDEVHPVELQEGATVEGTYSIGPFNSHLCYQITEFLPGRQFSYESGEDHPLKGGATVRIVPRYDESTLRWTGHYRPRVHFAAPAAVAFVKLYFIRHFFGALEAKLRRYEANRQTPADHRRPSP